jgi:anti-sigma regulatory factor (Ser/Thr protein kinase)
VAVGWLEDDATEGPSENGERLQFPAAHRSVGDARRFVRSVIERHGCDAEDAVLLLSELATNVVDHARTAFTVTVVMGDGVVRVEVHDGLGGALVPTAEVLPVADGERGRGLGIVRALARGWGWEERPGGKTVWFELPAVSR